MKKLLITVLAASVISAGVFAATNTNHPGREGFAGPFPRLRAMAGAIGRRLDLTETQRVAIKDVIKLHRPELQPLIAQARSSRAELRAIVTAPTLDEAALAAQADTMAATHKQIVVASAHLRADLRKILTPEQLAKVEAWRRRAMERRAEMREMFLDPVGQP